MKCVSNANTEVFIGLCFDLPLKWHLSLHTHRQDEICCWWGLDKEDWGVILNNLQDVLSIDSWDILQLWEGSPYCRNNFPFWLFPLLKLCGNLSKTNFQNNAPFLFPSYQNHSVTPLSSEMGTINLVIHMSSTPFFLALPAAFPFLSTNTSTWCHLFIIKKKTRMDSKCFLCNCQIF